MAAGVPDNSPFLKQLVSSDKKARDHAVESLRTYLTSGKTFTELELLKLWRGLFFCMWHSDRPLTQQRLSKTLASLLTPLPDNNFIPFISAFWKTIVTNYGSIDSLRMDKFLYLIRCYVNAAFTYIRTRDWQHDLLREYLDVVRDVLCESQGKVSDGLRYHILDIWIDELDQVDRDGTAPVKDIISPVEEVASNGRTKILKQHAKEALEDERLKDWQLSRQANANTDDADEDTSDDS